MKEFLVTRSQLAVSLIEAGGKYRLTKSPYRPDYVAWWFELNDTTRKVAVEFYREIGKPIPRVLQTGGDTIAD